MSADGSTIIANVADSLGINYPAIFRESNGWTAEVLSPPDGYLKCDFNRANGYSINEGGTKVTGILWDGCDAKVFLWTEATGMQDLGPTRGSRISDDGTVIGGFTDRPSGGARSPAIWLIDGTTSTGPINLDDPMDEGEVYDMTSNGSRFIGTAYPVGSPPEMLGYQAFIWDPGDTNITLLGTLSGSLYDISKATHIADNGMIFGVSGPSSISVTSFVWTPVIGMVDLKQFLIDQGAEGVTNSTRFKWIKEVSGDGSTLVGEWTDLYGGWGYYKVTFDTTSPVMEMPAAGSHLTRVHPNPFNPTTTVEFTLERGQMATVAVYDLRGRKVAVLADREFPAGDHGITWQGRDRNGRLAASGSYIVRLETEDGADQQVVTLLK